MEENRGTLNKIKKLKSWWLDVVFAIRGFLIFEIALNYYPRVTPFESSVFGILTFIVLELLYQKHEIMEATLRQEIMDIMVSMYPLGEAHLFFCG